MRCWNVLNRDKQAVFRRPRLKTRRSRDAKCGRKALEISNRQARLPALQPRDERLIDARLFGEL